MTECDKKYCYYYEDGHCIKEEIKIDDFGDCDDYFDEYMADELQREWNEDIDGE